MPNDMRANEMGMTGRGGHLYMQTNEVKNAVIHYHRSVNGTLTEVERVSTGELARGLSSPSVGKRVRPTPLKERPVSFSRRIGNFCSSQMAGTIRFPASLSATRATLS